MWKCAVCGAGVDDDAWTECWKCGASRTAEPSAVEQQRAEVAARLAKAKRLGCVRCDTPLRFLGTKRFHEGTRQFGFWLGDLGELFVHREAYDVYACPACGKVELFIDGLGEDQRPEERQDHSTLPKNGKP